MSNLYRIIDASLNRASEGIRVLEDYARFYLNNTDRGITKDLRDFRHKLRKNLAGMDGSLLSSRDIVNDPGIEISQTTDRDRKTSDKQVILSNFKRIEEAIRTIEETLKLVNNDLSKAYELLRFEAYQLEKRYVEALRREIPKGIYGITSERHSGGKSSIEVVKSMAKSGIKIIQYREKYKKPCEKLAECKEIRKITSDYNIVFIINDHADICLAVDADGVHLGQDDLPASDMRRIVGNKIIGVSTHSEKQAQKAIKDGADYIGVGPIFPTDTKDDVCDPVGLQYLEYAVSNVHIPFVSIGGIRENNIDQVIKRGAERIALVSEIVGSSDIEGKIRRLLAFFNTD